MAITFDPAKRDATLAGRGLDFARAEEVFMGKSATLEDDRVDYGEIRFLTAGYLDGRCVMVAWTWRGVDQRIISMRYVHAREERRWFG